jgi:hypothetical protein
VALARVEQEESAAVDQVGLVVLAALADLAALEEGDLAAAWVPVDWPPDSGQPADS